MAGASRRPREVSELGSPAASALAGARALAGFHALGQRVNSELGHPVAVSVIVTLEPLVVASAARDMRPKCSVESAPRSGVRRGQAQRLERPRAAPILALAVIRRDVNGNEIGIQDGVGDEKVTESLRRALRD